MGKNILVVDDDPVGGALMEARLSKEGYSVVRTINGQKALAAAQHMKPALIVLDVEMPEMNGYTFMNELRKIDGIKDTPVIVLTAHEENKGIFARKGIGNYLVKPVNFDALFAAMKKLLPETAGNA
jgi:CheY-like chemotaxis protein